MTVWHGQVNVFPISECGFVTHATDIWWDNMQHFASNSFWRYYDGLPAHIKQLADKNFELLKQNPRHPSLDLKKVGRFWSVRIGDHYRALATEADGDMRWHWIGSHATYDTKLKR